MPSRLRRPISLAARASDEAANAEALAARAQQQYRSLNGAIKKRRVAPVHHRPRRPHRQSGGRRQAGLRRGLRRHGHHSEWVARPPGASTPTSARNALAAARKANRAANRAAAQAAGALQGEQDQLAQLAAELHALAGDKASQVLADHAALAAQAGNELASVSALQFNPHSTIPPPLATTSVALAWAFAELGKPYVWGATGPEQL